ncbi:Diacylglycerol O-acyltransferase 2 [Rhizophlyctis rosea]|nr:Diacylglycerol O-acyltransferase 2 [Rhizophlyctis rosea]
MKKNLSFSVPLIWGTFWFYPRKVQLATVVGAPIDVKKTQNPTDEYINEIHAQYVKSLQELYDAHKDRFAKNRKKDLRILDQFE